MEKWIDVVTNPLGLAGFALFLVFTVLSRVGGDNRPSWLMPTFIAMALISLVGGLWLASSGQRRDATATSAPGTTDVTVPSPAAGPSSVTQTTSGDRSPAVSGVSGNVTITTTDREDERDANR